MIVKTEKSESGICTWKESVLRSRPRESGSGRKRTGCDHGTVGKWKNPPSSIC